MQTKVKEIKNGTYEVELDCEAVELLEWLCKRPEPDCAPATAEYILRWIIVDGMKKREKWYSTGKQRKHPARSKMVTMLEDGPMEIKDLRKEFYYLGSVSFNQSLRWAIKAGVVEKVGAICRLGPKWEAKPIANKFALRGEKMIGINITEAIRNREKVLECLATFGELTADEVHLSTNTHLQLRTTRMYLNRLISERKVEQIGRGRATRYRLAQPKTEQAIESSKELYSEEYDD